MIFMCLLRLSFVFYFINYVIFFYSINMVYYTDIYVLNQSGIPKWSWRIMFFIDFWIVLVIILLRIFVAIFMKNVGL